MQKLLRTGMLPFTIRYSLNKFKCIAPSIKLGLRRTECINNTTETTKQNMTIKEKDDLKNKKRENNLFTYLMLWLWKHVAITYCFGRLRKLYYVTCKYLY